MAQDQSNVTPIRKDYSEHNISRDEKLEFLSEDELAQCLNANHWMNMPCGHDCCQCNTECK